MSVEVPPLSAFRKVEDIVCDYLDIKPTQTNRNFVMNEIGSTAYFAMARHFAKQENQNGTSV